VGQNPLLEDALTVIRAWGFTYKAKVVWVKDKLGTGFYVRSMTEDLLIATRGSFTPTAKRIRPAVSSLIVAPTRQHSRKPDEAYTLIERLYPGTDKIELFARSRRPGWAAWGDQL
jgi:N6-adenosine-specific RNA methylase IME4